VTTNRSTGFRSRVLSEPPKLKYWALLVAIRRVMVDVPYPAVVDVMDALLDPGQPTSTTVSGVRTTGRPVGRPRKDAAS
jgi:hypothetical protein